MRMEDNRRKLKENFFIPSSAACGQIDTRKAKAEAKAKTKAKAEGQEQQALCCKSLTAYTEKSKKEEETMEITSDESMYDEESKRGIERLHLLPLSKNRVAYFFESSDSIYATCSPSSGVVYCFRNWIRRDNVHFFAPANGDWSGYR